MLCYCYVIIFIQRSQIILQIHENNNVISFMSNSLLVNWFGGSRWWLLCAGVVVVSCAVFHHPHRFPVSPVLESSVLVSS